MGRLSRLWAQVPQTRGTLGTVADVMALVTFVGSGAVLVTGRDLPQSILAVYVAVLATILLVLLVVQERRLGRRARQAESMPRLAEAFESLTRASHHLKAPLGRPAFVAAAVQALDDLAAAYEGATGAPCRASIQQITFQAEGRDAEVRTICRNRRGGRKRETGARSAPDYVNDNSDFRDILHNGAAYFFSNDLPAELARGYRNSHWDEDMIKRGDFPYRATIVWPVRGPGQGPGTGDLVLGFLSVDTDRTHVFDEAIDVSAGQAFAHALYSALYAYQEPEPDMDQVGATRMDTA